MLDFEAVNTAAIAALPVLLRRWLPQGEIQGCEYVALNPTRRDSRPGSFKINMRTGVWSDFATGDAGGDVISLAAYLARCSQSEAAHNLARMLGVAHDR